MDQLALVLLALLKLSLLLLALLLLALLLLALLLPAQLLPTLLTPDAGLTVDQNWELFSGSFFWELCFWELFPSDWEGTW